MLLFSCHLVPFFPIYCFEGFVSDSSFLLLALCFLLLCFCLRGLPHPPFSVLCAASLLLFCHAVICFTFLSFFCLIVSYDAEKQILFLSAFFYMVLWGCHFPFSIDSLCVLFILVPRIPNTCPEECQSRWL